MREHLRERAASARTLAAALVLAFVGSTPLAAQAGGLVGAPAVDSLIAEGRLQEAAWTAREHGDTAHADAILDRLQAILETPPLDARPLGVDSQGVSYTFRLDHGQGVHSIFKVDGSDIFCRLCGADREVAAYAVDRLLGLDLTPMTVATGIIDSYGDTLSGSTMYFVRDASAPRDVDATKPDRLRFFDAVIGNSDRHKSNWLVLQDGRTVAIDHNRAFQYQPLPRPKTCWETEIDSIARPAEIGEPLRRYRTLSDDTLSAAVAMLDSELARQFVAMRPEILARIERRLARPAHLLPRSDCAFDDPDG